MGRRAGAADYDLTTLVVDEGTGLYVRPGTYDAEIVREARTYVRHMLPGPDDTLLDIGLNIGAVSDAFLKAGVRQVWGYEPEPMNAAVARLNLRDRPAEVHEMAVVGDDQPGEMILKVSGSLNRGVHSLLAEDAARLPDSTVTPVLVRTVPFSSLLEREPTLLKIDIEGGEYLFMDRLLRLPPSVRAVAVEWHVRKRPGGWRAAKPVHEGIQAAGLRLRTGTAQFRERMSWTALCVYRKD